MEKTRKNSQSQTSPPYSPDLKQHQKHRSNPKTSVSLHHPVPPAFSRSKRQKEKQETKSNRKGKRREIFTRSERERGIRVWPSWNLEEQWEISKSYPERLTISTKSTNGIIEREDEKGFFIGGEKEIYLFIFVLLSKWGAWSSVAEGGWDWIKSASSLWFVDFDRLLPKGNENMPRSKFVW